MTDSLPKPRPVQGLALVAALVVVWFVLRRLDSSLSDAIDVVRSASAGYLAASGLAALVAMTAIALGWVPLVRNAGGTGSAPHIVAWYFLGEITKYVPGGIWPVLGRGELAAGTSGRRAAYRSVTHSLVVFFGLASLPSIIAVIRFDDWGLLPRLTCAAALACVVPVVAFAVRVPWPALLSAVMAYALAWLAIGLTTLLAARALDLSIGVVDAVAITAAAWLVGFVIVFVPGGVGVREAAFVALAPSALEPSQALAIALVARLLFVAADMVGLGVGLVFRAAADRDGAPS